MTTHDHFTILKRNFPSGNNSYLRKRHGDVLEISVQLSGMGSDFKVMLHTDIFSGGIEWQDHPLNNTDGGTHQIKIPLEKIGCFGFRLKFTGDGGNSWHWDKKEYGRLAVEPSSLNSLRIYTLIPNASGSFKEWIKRLDEIKKMGFNVIQLLPLTTMDSSKSPYATRELTEFDKGYLDPLDNRSGEDQFLDFKQDAEAKGFMLCIDLVLNHIGLNNPMIHQHPEWIVPDSEEEDGFKRAGWWKGKQWVKWDEIVLLNYDHPEPEIRQAIWDTMTKYCFYWSGMITKNSGILRLDNFHSSHQGFIAHILTELRREFPDILILAELFEQENLIHQYVWTHQLSLLLGTEWEEKFVPELRRLLKYMHSETHSFKFFTPVNSHDSGTPTQEFGTPASLYPRYIIAALLGMGFTGIVQGVESGAEKQLNFMGPQRGSEHMEESEYSLFIGKINRIMASDAVFLQKSNVTFVDNEHDAVIAAVRTDGLNHIVLVIANLDNFNGCIVKINMGPWITSGSETVRFKDLYTGENLHLRGPKFELSIPSSGFRVLELHES